MRARWALASAVIVLLPSLGRPEAPCDADATRRPYSADRRAGKDATRALQRALDEVAAEGGGRVCLPPGRYRVEGQLRVPAHTTLVGTADAPRGWKEARTHGAVLEAWAQPQDPDGPPFITLAGVNATLAGLTIHYPEQTSPETTPWAPREYPWTVRAGGEDNVALLDVMLLNPYQGVDLGTRTSGRHLVRGLFGQPLKTGILVDKCYDVGRIKHVHFWPFWSDAPAVLDYMRREARAFVFKRTDWQVVDDVFAWGYHVGIELSASADGVMNGQMTNVNLDAVDVGLDVVDVSEYGIHVSGLNVANAGGGSTRIAVRGRPGATQGSLMIRGASFWGSWNEAVRWDNPGLVSISDSLFVAWGKDRPALHLASGRAKIHDNTFADRGGVAIRIDPTAAGVAAHDNDLGGNAIDVHAPAERILLHDNFP